MFQSTRPHGARPEINTTLVVPVGFNPRARVGRDFFDQSIIWNNTGFNPRARVGRDVTGDWGAVPEKVSIHAPAWGATA